MSKRYVFFRTPAGKAYEGFDGKHAPTHLLSEIGQISTVNSTGEVGWTEWSMMKYEEILRSVCLVMDRTGNELNDTDAWGIIYNALISVIKESPGNPVNASALLEKASELAALFFRSRENHYVLVTSLSVAELPAKRISIGGCKISSLRIRGTRFPLPTILGSDFHRSSFPHLASSKYSLVKIATSGRSVFEATDRALNAVNLLRGLWSLFATRGSWRKHLGSPQREPLGVIHLGPVHTLHFPDGKPAADELYWFDPDYVQDRELFKYDGYWPKIEKVRKSAGRRLLALNYRPEIEALIVRYVIALDQIKPEIAFLQMWSILERITNTVGGNYDDTINRAVWFDRNRLLGKDLLQAVRSRRNQYGHSGDSGHEADQVAYTVKAFVDSHLFNLIANPLKFQSLQEYGDFLALPSDVKIIQEKAQKLRAALRIKASLAASHPNKERN